MFKESFTLAGNQAYEKWSFLSRNPIGYFVASMLAGAFVGFGVILAFVAGGLLEGEPYAKLVMGALFSVALSLVVFAGAELFTGNNLVMSAGLLNKKVNIGQTLGLWGVCWLGNLCGSVILAVLYVYSGCANSTIGEFMANAALAKMSAEPLQLFLRAVLCNVLVCLAVWTGYRCKSDSAKLILIFWCIITFFAAGFEHSVANMTLLSISLLNPCGVAVCLGGCVYNLLIVTLGNIAGGAVLLTLPYYVISKK